MYMCVCVSLCVFIYMYMSVHMYMYGKGILCGTSRQLPKLVPKYYYHSIM